MNLLSTSQLADDVASVCFTCLLRHPMMGAAAAAPPAAATATGFMTGTSLILWKWEPLKLQQHLLWPLAKSIAGTRKRQVIVIKSRDLINK